MAVTLHAASTAVDTDFTAKLCRVDPDGESVNLKQGIVRARFRESRSTPSPIEPGRIYEYRIDLGPLGARIPAGYRLRLDVSSSDFPHWDSNLNTGGPLGREGPEAAIVATRDGPARPAAAVAGHVAGRDVAAGLEPGSDPWGQTPYTCVTDRAESETRT